MKKPLPSDRLHRIKADKDFAKAHDRMEDLRLKHGLWPDDLMRIPELKIPEADKKEMISLEAEMSRLAKASSPL